MHELEALLKAFAESQNNGEKTFLATVVDTKGSTYRRSGARMLMTSGGRIVGTISGGCLENDIFEQARQRKSTDASFVVNYDNSFSEDIVWGFGIGCSGAVRILIEPLDRQDRLNPIEFFARCLREGKSGVIATVFAIEGAIKARIGARLILNPDGTMVTDIEEPTLKEAIALDAGKALTNLHASVNKYELAFGSVEVFIESVRLPTSLVIFGAGSDAVPVVKFAKALGWRVSVVDCRALEITRERFLIADEVILTRRDILHRQISIDSRTVAVAMTHNYLDDLEILEVLLSSPATYIGVLGAKHRTQKLIEDLSARMIRVPSHRLHAPIGIDIGADTPEEIALAIVAEIQAVLTNRRGGLLKESKTPLHREFPRQTRNEIKMLDRAKGQL